MPQLLAAAALAVVVVAAAVVWAVRAPRPRHRMTRATAARSRIQLRPRRP